MNHQAFERHNQTFIPSCLLNYVYVVVMWWHDTCLCEHFVTAYAIDMSLNIQLETLKYIITQKKTHTEKCFFE